MTRFNWEKLVDPVMYYKYKRNRISNKIGCGFYSKFLLMEDYFK